ncbi:MAG: class A beta-lactamase-related serine hydrolase [Actinomycetota bacterium]|nr:class A beta-lactamase-related serine hydrolase [Actinomycetota bacterium]
MGFTRGIAAIVVAALALALIAPAVAETTWRPKTGRANRWANQRQGSISFAVKDTEGRMHARRARTRVPMASTLKVMFLVAYLRQDSVRHRRLRDSDKSLLAPMIRRSDNETATRIADRLGPRPMYRLARKARMRDFHYTRPWGLSTTSARDQARFMFRVDRFVPKRHRGYARWLLSHIIQRQRWGIGKVDTQGWRKLFKGGWGSGSGAVDHQVVLLKRKDGTRVGLAVMTTNSPSHDYGKRTLRGVFARLLRTLP